MIALCCNADGIEKLKPFVIGKAGNPCCFKNFNIRVYFDYVHNKKALMTSVNFYQLAKKWLWSQEPVVKNMKSSLTGDYCIEHED